MTINIVRNRMALWVVTGAVIALSAFQLPANAQKSDQADEITRVGATALVGLARGQKLRFTAFNPSTTESHERNEPIRMQVLIYTGTGESIAESPAIVIPPGEFRFVDFDRDDLPVTGEPGTARAQLRTIPLWGLRSHSRFNVSTSLELVDDTTGSTHTWFVKVEALP
ncbi:MAG TPA: hypothetical protein VFB82_25190 [Blastocatellia bacterium]|nr:hypothetical protein [Blastocatellia bacterium]